MATDDGHVNIGDTKTIVAAVASEATLPPKEPVVSAGPEDGAAQSVHAPEKAQGSPTVQSSTNMASKGTLKGQVIRKSGGRKKTGEASGASGAHSGVGSSSKSPAGKLKKRGQAGLDKEAKEALKAMDTKIEDLRK